jgi:outer membrane protein
MNRTTLFALVIASGMLAPTLALADTKVAYVDLQRALEETEDGKKAKAKLKSDFDRKQKELDDKQEELKKMKDALDKKATSRTFRTVSSSFSRPTRGCSAISRPRSRTRRATSSPS